MIPQDLQDLKDVREVIRLAMEQLGPDAGIEDLRRAYVTDDFVPSTGRPGWYLAMMARSPTTSAFHGPLVVGGRARASRTMPKRPSRSGVAPVCQTGR